MEVRIIAQPGVLGAQLSVMSTLLIFVAIPLAVIVVVAALVHSGSERNRSNRRYRPGRPYDFAPIWFLAAPEQVTATGGAAAQPAERPAIEAGIIEDSAGQRVLPGPVGGASDRW
jgi:hypothetical protein